MNESNQKFHIHKAVSEQDEAVAKRLEEIYKENPKPHSAKLTFTDISTIRHLNNCGRKSLEISQLIPCSYFTVRNILANRSHVGDGMAYPDITIEKPKTDLEQNRDFFQMIIDECDDMKRHPNAICQFTLDDGRTIKERGEVRAHAVEQLKLVIDKMAQEPELS